MSEKYAYEFNLRFENAELLVDAVTAAVEKDFTVDDYENNRSGFELIKGQTDNFMQEMIKSSICPIGIYITFNPETSRGEDEIWYVKRENGEIIYIDSVEISDGWLVEETDSTEYYFKTIRDGAYWSDAGYDPGMNGYVITYTKAVYDKNNDLIGVVGADILVDDLFTSLGKIEKEISGNAVIIDKNENIVAGAKQNYPKHSTVESKVQIGDKWELVLIQPISIATEPIAQTEASVIILGLLILIAAIIIVIYFSRAKVAPMINEAEQKEALLINQARQAKMGEMVGNIAHQWKQPLNNMKMSVSNMQNDYDNGNLNDEELSWYTMRITSMIDSLSQTVDDFTNFLKPARSKEKFSVQEEIKNVLNMMNENIRINSINTEVKGKEIFLTGYRNEFSQCLFNLIDNARDALIEGTPGRREIVITTEIKEDNLYIKVFNNGEQIDNIYKDKIFDIYFTTKEEKEGTGIGLYLTKEIIEKHFDGTVYFKNTVDGVEFVIKIPADIEKGVNQ